MTETITPETIADPFAGAGVSFANKCYRCRHRAQLIGDAHSACRVIEQKDPPASINIQFEPHGVAHGWANWPYNFDPLWLRFCDGFQEEVPF